MASTGINTPQNTVDVVNGERLFGGQLFEIFVTFDNHTTKKYALPTAHILEMIIEEDLSHWPYKGYIIYNNHNEGIERNDDENAWFYRMDARDEINIKVKLKDEDENTEFPPEVWEMDLDFIIYDTEDIPVPNVRNKMKKIYFWDKRYQMMMDKKIYWSTTIALKLKNAAYATDDERSMLTGDAIEKLLTEAAGYEDSIDKENWDKGITKQFYTSPMHSSIADDLNYLLSGHLTEENDDIAIFKYNHRFEKKQWQLIPVHKLFDNAGFDGDTPGKWQLEHLFFEDIEPGEGKNTTPLRAPWRSPITKELDFEVDIKAAEYNKIATYEFVDMSGIDNTNALVSKPVYSYCLKTGSFAMDYADNEISKVKSEFKRLYTDKLLPKGSAEPIFTLNDTKTKQINTRPEFTFAKTAHSDNIQNRLIQGRGKILYGGLMLNEFIKFRLLGSPHRTVGKFVGIDRMTSDLSLDFDNKICGQWLVTNVKHIWNHNRYVNDVCAIKVHRHSINKDIKEDIQ